jgi:hypothetical protein
MRPNKKAGERAKRSPQKLPKLNECQWLHVPVTLEPKRKLKAIKATDKQIDSAVTQAEFLARVLEHEQVTEHLANTIRALTVASCLYTARALEKHRVDPQMVRDIYPYAACLESKTFNDLFQTFLYEMAGNEPAQHLL